MAAPALYGHGTRWRRPEGEEARDGSAGRPAPLLPPPRSAVPEERSWAGFSSVPEMVSASCSSGASRRPAPVGELECSPGALGSRPC